MIPSASDLERAHDAFTAETELWSANPRRRELLAAARTELDKLRAGDHGPAMKLLANISLKRGIVLLAIALCILVGGISGGIKVTTDHLLYEDATKTARNWADLVAETVTDLDQIANGEQPSSASMKFFQWAQKSGDVFRYEIYNRQGYSQLVSEHGVAQVNLSHYSKEAVRSLRWGPAGGGCACG